MKRWSILAVVLLGCRPAPTNQPDPTWPLDEPEQRPAASRPAVSSGESSWETSGRESSVNASLSVDIDPVGPHGGNVEELPVVAPAAGYDRKQWKHWVDADGDCQDTRQEVLIEESEVRVTFKDERNCKVATGRWTCPYTGQVFQDPRKLDIDHLVPLGNAHATGGSSWSAVRKRDFANNLADPNHLIAVSASANRSKGQRSPDQWMPTNGAYRCDYMRAWVSVKSRWGLGVTQNESAALKRMAGACQR